MPDGVVALLTVGGFFGVSASGFGGATGLDPLALLATGAIACIEVGTTGGASDLTVAMGADGGRGG